MTYKKLFNELSRIYSDLPDAGNHYFLLQLGTLHFSSNHLRIEWTLNTSLLQKVFTADNPKEILAKARELAVASKLAGGCERV